jgi:hypothetical protein
MLGLLGFGIPGPLACALWFTAGLGKLARELLQYAWIWGSGLGAICAILAIAEVLAPRWSAPISRVAAGTASALVLLLNFLCLVGSLALLFSRAWP